MNFRRDVDFLSEKVISRQGRRNLLKVGEVVDFCEKVASEVETEAVKHFIVGTSEISQDGFLGLQTF